MSETMKQMQDKVAALSAQLYEVESELRQARMEAERRREEALPDLARTMLQLAVASVEDDFMEVHEGDLSHGMSGYDLPRGDYETMVLLSSAHERKGYLETNDDVMYVNNSYRNNECVVLTVVVPRDRVLSELEKFQNHVNGE